MSDKICASYIYVSFRGSIGRIHLFHFVGNFYNLIYNLTLPLHVGSNSLLIGELQHIKYLIEFKLMTSNSNII
jgi:hypothetical protein